MHKIPRQDFFSAILSSNILEPYLAQNSDLSELTRSPDHPDIHYVEDSAPAGELAPALKRRLSVMVARNLTHNLEATRQLVAFMEEHPDSRIYNVTFNCPTRHYGVRCGLVDDHLQAICVMTGGHLPEALLGGSIL